MKSYEMQLQHNTAMHSVIYCLNLFVYVQENRELLVNQVIKHYSPLSPLLEVLYLQFTKAYLFCVGKTLISSLKCTHSLH